MTAGIVKETLAFYTRKLGLSIFTDQPFDDTQRWIELKIAGLPMFRFARWFAPRVVGRAMERGLGDLVHAAASTRAAC